MELQRLASVSGCEVPGVLFAGQPPSLCRSGLELITPLASQHPNISQSLPH
ncbi:hypothetical protein MGG_17085 [Pyricularia oryzae 70-15]|uniref:Uncharacterized protein n=1 Tax=Pyricularia oryzae (strain 70-15 / ATCC MYA-4617 / FGSC 8958) TaxID=242507 RepID=G4N822_PYRO7|nr:uncharacterized protein MGG_17085 [Pyricularia oryzae 70-15]EHA50124.1 hypothetical protein MGG_17085 [Pyricularia oryzae 70-15]